MGAEEVGASGVSVGNGWATTDGVLGEGGRIG